MSANKPTRYKTLAEINAALGYLQPAVEKVEKAILGNGNHKGLITAMVVAQNALEEHLKQHATKELRRTKLTDKLWVGTILVIIGNIVLFLKGCVS